MKRFALLLLALAACGGPVAEHPPLPLDAGSSLDAGAPPPFLHADTVINDGGADKMGCPYLHAGAGQCSPDALPEHDIHLSAFALEGGPVQYPDAGVARLTFAEAQAECERVGGDLPTEAQAEHVGPWPESTWVRDWYYPWFYSTSPTDDPIDTTDTSVHQTRGGTAEGYSTARWEREPRFGDDGGEATAAVRCVYGG